MRTFDRKDIFTIVAAEEAKAYIGKLGYFGHSLEDLERKINECDCDELAEVVHENYTSNVFRPRGYESAYSLFLPDDKVKNDEENKWRAFTLEEFNKTIPMGTVFKYRYKSRDGSDNRYVKSIYYHASIEHENGNQSIFFEDCAFNLGYCFEVMELFLNGKWQPFGMKE